MTRKGLIKSIKKGHPVHAGAQACKSLLAISLYSGTEMRLLVLGREGSGKSALVNSFLGFNREDSLAAPESNAGYSATTSVNRYVGHKNGIKVEFYDTPGLGNERNAQIVLDQICKETNDEVDVVLFCIALSRGIRVDDGYYKLISLLTKMFGQNFWSKTIFVLTFVNDSPYKEVSQGELHRRTIQNVKQELERAMRVANVDSSIAESVPLLPAGYERECLPHEAREWNETLFNACRECETVRSVVPLLQRKTHPISWRVAVICAFTLGGGLAGLQIGRLSLGVVGALVFAFLFGAIGARIGGTVSSGAILKKNITP